MNTGNLIPEPVFMAQPEELDMMRLAAMNYNQRREYPEMEGVLVGLSLMEPGDPWVHSALGFARHCQGKLDTARVAYTRALELSDGKDLTAAVNLVGVLLMLGEVDLAIEHFRKVVETGVRTPELTAAIERIEAAVDSAPETEQPQN